ncbi:hypothetical protein [Burkholderia diffusa]|uniref:hypothetical protein n=2 Tax=Burkholderia diffusa TaxID=488732 RepID=UPI0015822BB9|nr:hypothetical protein [Burkholderia diffusa]
MKYLISIILSSFSLFPLLSYGQQQTTSVGAYSNCRWVDLGSSTQVSVDISFIGEFAGTAPRSRAIYVYRYDKNGTPAPFGRDTITASKDGSPGETVLYHAKYTGFASRANNAWLNPKVHTATFTVSIDSAQLTDWPAITIQGGTFAPDVLMEFVDMKGGVYVHRVGTTSNCTVISNPTVPPPVPIEISMNAPDWNLGELSRGTSEKILSNISDQLCITYAGTAVNGKKFVVSATGSNGAIGNRYQLQNSADPSQRVPYSITLSGGMSGIPIQLPNVGNEAISLDSSGRTCFVPTFTTMVDENVEPGTYTDVLTFTVVTKT